MAKPFAEGLRYFPFDIDFIDNTKIERMEEDFGDAGVMFVIKVWRTAYKNGYFMELQDDFVDQFCRKILKKPIAEFNVLLNASIKYKIFDKDLYNQYNILTSDGIQRRFLEITKRRKQVKMIQDFIIKEVDIDPYYLFITTQTGRVIYEKRSAKHKGSRGTYKKSEKVEKIDNPTSSISPSTEFIQIPNFINNNKVPTEEIRRFCNLVYDEQNEIFKKQTEEAWFNSYVGFNEFIDDECPEIRISEYQINIDKYKKLLSKPIDSNIATVDELKQAVMLLAGNGVKETYVIHLKLADYIKYVRENKIKNSKNGQNVKKSLQPSTKPFGKL